jgi:hypothetical protein
MLLTQISFGTAGYGATGAYGSNLGQNAGLFATGALIQMSLDNLLDNLRQMLMFQISW